MISIFIEVEPHRMKQMLIFPVFQITPHYNLAHSVQNILCLFNVYAVLFFCLYKYIQYILQVYT